MREFPTATGNSCHFPTTFLLFINFQDELPSKFHILNNEDCRILARWYFFRIFADISNAEGQHLINWLFVKFDVDFPLTNRIFVQRQHFFELLKESISVIPPFRENNIFGENFPPVFFFQVFRTVQLKLLLFVYLHLKRNKQIFWLCLLAG